MKLGPRDAAGYFAKPDTKRAGLLIYGADSMRVALRRQEVIAALIGPKGEEDMRLSRMSGADLRKDPTILLDAIKEISFFPGPRVAFVEEATDTIKQAVTAAMEDWREGDATIIVTAGSLNKGSGLRKLFESHPNAYAVGIYDDPPSRQEIEASLQKAGIAAVGPDGMAALMSLSRALDPGDFRQTVEKLALFKLGDPAPVSPDDIAAISPVTIEADLDEVLNIVADARVSEIGPIMRRIEGQGINPVTLCIGATRHFRTLFAAAADPGGPAQGISRLRPPVFGPRRDKMLRQASHWGRPRLEDALQILTETDLTLRSTSRAPQMAVVERTFIRLAMMGKK